MESIELLHTCREGAGTARYYRVPWGVYDRAAICKALHVSKVQLRQPLNGGFIRMYADPEKTTVKICQFEAMPLPARIASQRR